MVLERDTERFTVGAEDAAEQQQPHAVQAALQGVLGVAASLALLIVPLQLSEVDVYKVGLAVIVFVAAMGLHVLVNWTGELSLAHAPLVGFPAILVAKISGDHDLSPIALLPVAVVVGAALGALVGLPALRAKGIQVALVTLAAGVAIDRFFFTKQWFVGRTGVATAGDPAIGPFDFNNSRSLYPALWATAALAGLAMWCLYRSKVARALSWIRTNPAAAAAFGVPVARYRVLAYAIAGALAGLAGGMTAMWVQRVTPQAFTLRHSLTFLVIVVLAGRGFIGGVAAAAAGLEGGRLFLSGLGPVFEYLGPVSLVGTLTTYKAGLNGFGRQLGQRIGRTRVGAVVDAWLAQQWRREVAMTGSDKRKVTPGTVLGAVVVAAGFIAIGLAWQHAGETSQLWVQNQELISGGIGGLALVVVGVAIVVRDQLVLARREAAERWGQLFAALGRRDAPSSDRSTDRSPVLAVREPVRAGGRSATATTGEPGDGG